MSWRGAFDMLKVAGYGWGMVVAGMFMYGQGDLVEGLDRSLVWWLPLVFGISLGFIQIQIAEYLLKQIRFNAIQDFVEQMELDGRVRIVPADPETSDWTSQRTH